MKARGFAGALILVAVALVASVATPAGSSALLSFHHSRAGVTSKDSSTGTITGLVADTHNTPVAGVCVSVIPFGSSDFTPTSFATTASDGTYNITGLSPNEYYLDFDPTCGGTIHSLLGSNDGQPVNINAGVTVVLDVALPPAQGTITGIVTNSSGSPVAGVCVNWAGGFTVTASNGSYSLTLAPDIYTLVFALNGCDTFSGPTVNNVVVSPAAVTTVNVTVNSGTTTPTTIPSGPPTTTTSQPQGSTTTVPSGTGMVAPPPSPVAPGALGMPLTSNTNFVGATTISTTFNGQVKVDVLVPNLALPSSEFISLYPVAEPTDFTPVMPYSSQTYVAGLAVSWIGSDGSTPMSSLPISVTLQNADIKVGDPIYDMNSVGQLIDAGQATLPGVVNTRILKPSLIVVATKPPSQGGVGSSPQPRTIRASFGSTSSLLSAATKTALLNMIKQLHNGAVVTVTGYALRASSLARSRAQEVKRFLLARRELTVRIKIVTNRALSLVTVALLRQ